MDVREKLVELLWEYDQMRMMRMSIEECADRLIPKGLTVGKCENDTKCSDLAICLDENSKEKTERIVDLMTLFYGVDPGYYGVEAYPLASHLIAHGVTVQEWYSVNDCMPEDLEENKGKKVINCIVEHDPYGNGKTTAQFRQRKYDCYYKEWHWSKIGGCTVTRWTMMPQPPKGE